LQGAFEPNVRGEERLDVPVVEVAVQQVRVVKAAAESQRRSAKRAGTQEQEEDGPGSGDLRQRLIHRDPGRAVMRNLRVRQDEAGHPLVDESELARNPAAGVVADERVGIDAELAQRSLERPGLSLRGIVVAGGAA